MADATEGLDPAVETEAKIMGWVPEAEYKGKAPWIPADAFVERGHTIMPILKKNNQDLIGKLTKAQTDLATLALSNARTEQTVKDLVAFQAAEVKRQVEAKVADLKAELREARRGDDPDLVSDLEEKLDGAKDRLKEVAAPPPPPPPSRKEDPAPEPWAAAFNDDNSDWFNVDRKKTALFMVEADELFRNSSLRGAALLEKAKANVELFLSPAPPADKGEGGSRGNGGGGGGGGKGYSSLPSDARAVCDSQAKQFVGTKAFPTLKDWQTHYATVYNES